MFGNISQSQEELFMKTLLPLLTSDVRNAAATEQEIGEFERRHNLALPSDYRSFLLTVANGGSFGPEYGLYPLGYLPPHWSSDHHYDDCLSRPFPLEREWIWEDEPDEPQLESRIDQVEDGVLFLGEEGCGARWAMVLNGTQPGRVWLMTG
jgi:hypothetical protein